MVFGHMDASARDSPLTPMTPPPTSRAGPSTTTSAIDLDAFFAEADEEEEIHFGPSLDIAALERKENAKHAALRKAGAGAGKNKEGDGVINAHSFDGDEGDKDKGKDKDGWKTKGKKKKDEEEDKPKRVYAKLDAERYV